MSALLEVRLESVALGARAVLRDIAFSVAPGEIVALVGPNGAGKTTLLRAIAGLLPARGEIRLGGAALATLKPTERARRVAYLAQEGAIHWPLSVRDVVALGRVPHVGAGRALRAADRAIVEAAIQGCCLDHLADRPTDALSGGERARVLLARALAVEAPLLLADEPIAALDPALQVATLRLLQAQAEAGRAVVTVMHDLGQAARIAGRFLVLVDGRLVADGSPKALFESGALARAFGIGFTLAEAEGMILVAPRVG